MSAKTFRRYTNLAAVVHLLHAKAVTLLNPATWDDRNDAYYMAEYKRLKQAKCKYHIQNFRLSKSLANKFLKEPRSQHQ